MFIDQHLYKCQKNSCMRSQLTTVITIIVVFIMVIFMIDDRQSWTMWSTTLRSLLTMRGVRSTSAFHIPQTRFTFTDNDCFCPPNLTFDASFKVREAIVYQNRCFFTHCVNVPWPPLPPSVLHSYVADFTDGLLKSGLFLGACVIVHCGTQHSFATIMDFDKKICWHLYLTQVWLCWTLDGPVGFCVVKLKGSKVHHHHLH